MDTSTRAEAERLVENRLGALRATYGLLDAKSDRGRQAVVAAVREVEQADALFVEASRLFREVELLRLLYPDLPGTRLPEPPAPPNVASAVFGVQYKAARSLRPLSVPHRVHASPEERRGDELRAVRRYLEQHRREIDPQIVSVLEAALGNGGAP